MAYFNTSDQNHSSALNTAKILAVQDSALYVTDYIFSEVVTVSFLKLKSLKEATRIGKLVRQSCNMIYTEKNVFESAWQIFSEQRLQLSFVDCITIATMKNQKIRQIATFDRDFTKIEEMDVV
ncbi:type II toxin-antitoxin system VapC family toxin [Candidatus Nitrosotenuis uzonensis]|uniref:type II toxin-antitoxin system VapC family toxin n=1 Tax=Candidatus Nitrosotenuis uzonensis TaxID=1407055 RepID=UPI001B7D77C2|nr:PIN domain-containing protein [Candidatus Nitrosotenuis uzonensis]